MFMIMSQICLYDIFYTKLPDLYNNQSLQKTFSYSLALTLTSVTVHSRVTIGGWSMEYNFYVSLL